MQTDDTDIYAPGMSTAADLRSYRTDFAYGDDRYRVEKTTKWMRLGT